MLKKVSAVVKYRMSFTLDKRREYNARYKAKYPNRPHEQSARYRARNKDKIAQRAAKRNASVEGRETRRKLYLLQRDKDGGATLRAQAAIRYEKNRDKINQQKREAYRRKLEINRRRGREYHQANSKKRNTAKKERRKLNLPTARRREREAAERRRSKRRIYAKLYSRLKPEIGRARCAKRRALKKGAEVGDLRIIRNWEKSWRNKLLAKCYWCSRRVSSRRCHTDHILPISGGGAHVIENLCISCATCNVRKSAKDRKAWNLEITQPILL